MNIIDAGSSLGIEAKVSRSDNRNGTVIYSFIESPPYLSVGKQEILLAQIKACKRLLNQTKKEESEPIVLNKEIYELKLTKFKPMLIQSAQEMIEGNHVQ
jgi:hypothetical protein